MCKLDARSDGTSSFLIEDSDSSGKGKKVCAMYHRAPGTPLYLPVHQSCMKLAELFINAYKWRQLRRSVVPEYDIASDKILWDVLHRRLYGADPHTQQWELPEPHDYFGGKRCRNTEWEPDNDSKEGIVSYFNHLSKPQHRLIPRKILEYDPMADIPGLTGHILSNLQELQEDDWSDSEDSTYGTLSLQEMKSLQEQSYQILVHPTTFPWLWELDKNEVSERKGKKEGSWDWSLLVESLLRRGIHEADTKILELPDQLKNRRRIWRVLEEARIGDVAQKWEEQRLWEEQPGPIKSLR